MLPDDIKALRKELNLSAKQLAEALGTDQKTVFAWETGELFPTKRHVQIMERLLRTGTFEAHRPSSSAAPPASTAPASTTVREATPEPLAQYGKDTLASVKSAPPLSEKPPKPRTQEDMQEATVSVERLSDPRLWAIVKRLVQDADFFSQVASLAETGSEKQ